MSEVDQQTQLPAPDERLKASYKTGDIVRWNALALHGDDRNGWTVQGLEKDEGLLPIYAVKKGKRRGSAMQSDLEHCPTHARLQREAQEASVTSNNRSPTYRADLVRRLWEFQCDDLPEPVKRAMAEAAHELETSGIHEINFPCGHTVSREEQCPRCENERLRDRAQS